MKTLYACVEYGKVTLKEKELPAPGPGQLLLKANYSTMSPGTEQALMGEHIVPLPTSVGYSMCATVIEVGPEVEEFEVGDVVVTTGEHAQYLIMDALNCTPAPKNVDKAQAAFWNLGHTGLYAVRQADIKMGEPCVVQGQGFVGAMTAQMARLAGACPVIITCHHDNKLEASKAVGGIDYAINTKTDPEGLEKLLAELDLEIPVFFEATGQRSALLQAANLVGERGRVIMISQVHGQDMPPIDDPLMQKGASLIGTYVNSRPFALRRADLEITGVWPPVLNTKLRRFKSLMGNTVDEDIRVFLNMLAYGRLDITPLISHPASFAPASHTTYLQWQIRKYGVEGRPQPHRRSHFLGGLTFPHRI